jgi:hypothetical protein
VVHYAAAGHGNLRSHHLLENKRAAGAPVLDGEGNLLGILGPVRMDYQHAVGLLTTVADLLND